MDSARNVDAEPDPLQIGQQIGSFTVICKLRQGGMAIVYEARGKSGNRAAIKILSTSCQRDPQVVTRFADEARAVNLVAPLTRGVVDIYDTPTLAGGAECIIMEYLGGESLRERWHRIGGQAGVVELRLIRQIAGALDKVHAAGVVHRDVKPGNVMVVEDDAVEGGLRAKLIDFGVAKVRKQQLGDRQTEIGVTIGTPDYVAPETIGAAGAATPQADIYSLGVMLYELYAGRRPFMDQDDVDVLTQHRLDKPAPLEAVNPATPPEMAALVRRMLAKDPGARPSLQRVMETVDRLLAAAPVPRWRQLVPWLATAAGGIVVLAVLHQSWVHATAKPVPPDLALVAAEPARAAQPDLYVAPPDLVAVAPLPCVGRADGRYCSSGTNVLITCKKGRNINEKPCQSGCLNLATGYGICARPPRGTQHQEPDFNPYMLGPNL